jgi:predicted ArsR family transcriptional regulator
MQDVLVVDRPEQAAALLQPLRLALVKRMAAPRSCPELARELGQSTQKVNYHVHVLEAAGLVDRVAERRVRGVVEGVYRARAAAYWLSAALVGRIGGRRRARDRFSLGFLLTLAEELQADVGRLASRAESEHVPSLGLALDIELRPEEREAFMRELEEALQGLARRFGTRSGEAAGERFRLAAACYPQRDDEGRTET